MLSEGQQTDRERVKKRAIREKRERKKGSRRGNRGGEGEGEKQKLNI